MDSGAINHLDMNTTTGYLRRLVLNNETAFLAELAPEELVDVILCAGGFIHASRMLLPDGYMEAMLDMEVDEG